MKEFGIHFSIIITIYPYCSHLNYHYMVHCRIKEFVLFGYKHVGLSN